MANTPPGSGPYGTGVFVGTQSSQVIGARLNRQRLTFHNPSNVNISICPAQDSNGNPLAAVSGGAGSITLFPGGTLTLPEFDDGCGGAFNGIAVSGSQPLTIWEWL